MKLFCRDLSRKIRNAVSGSKTEVRLVYAEEDGYQIGKKVEAEEIESLTLHVNSKPVLRAYKPPKGRRVYVQRLKEDLPSVICLASKDVDLRKTMMVKTLEELVLYLVVGGYLTKEAPPSPTTFDLSLIKGLKLSQPEKTP